MRLKVEASSGKASRIMSTSGQCSINKNLTNIGRESSI